MALVYHLSIFVESVKGHDSFHQQGGNSDDEETDKDIVICDTGLSNVALEG